MSDSYKIYASKDYVDGKGLPDNAGAYQQLVADVNGNPTWSNMPYIAEPITIEHGEENWNSTKVDKISPGRIVDSSGTFATTINQIIRLKKVSGHVPTMEELFSSAVELHNYNPATGGEIHPPEAEYVFDGAYGRWSMTTAKQSGISNPNTEDGYQPLVLVVTKPLLFNIGSKNNNTYFADCYEPGTYMWLSSLGKKCGYVEFTYPHATPIEKGTVPVIQTATVGQTIVVKAVDEDGKPTEWEAADMGGGADLSSVVCLDREISLAGGEDGIYWSSDRIDMPIVPGVTYDIMYNGSLHSCVAKMTEYYGLYIGNDAIGGLGDGEDTGEPFELFNEGDGVVLTATSGELVKIKVTSANPDAMNFQTPILRIGYDDDGTAHLNYTFAEIVASYRNRMIPVFHSLKNVYPLYEMDIGNGDLSEDKIKFGFGIASITVNKDGSVNGAS